MKKYSSSVNLAAVHHVAYLPLPEIVQSNVLIIVCVS